MTDDSKSAVKAVWGEFTPKDMMPVQHHMYSSMIKDPIL